MIKKLISGGAKCLYFEAFVYCEGVAEEKGEKSNLRNFCNNAKLAPFHYFTNTLYYLI
jgi:hypothetical protein